MTMPLGFHTATAEQTAAANDEVATCETAADTMTEPTLARLHRECSTSSMNECWPHRRAALPTIEEIRRAHELRLQLSARCCGESTTSSTPWCVGTD
jgi:hypothetical protein